MTGKRPVRRAGIRPAKQLWLPLQVKGELFAVETEPGFPDMGDVGEKLKCLCGQEKFCQSFTNVPQNTAHLPSDSLTV